MHHDHIAAYRYTRSNVVSCTQAVEFLIQQETESNSSMPHHKSMIFCSKSRQQALLWGCLVLDPLPSHAFACLHHHAGGQLLGQQSLQQSFRAKRTATLSTQVNPCELHNNDKSRQRSMLQRCSGGSALALQHYQHWQQQQTSALECSLVVLTFFNQAIFMLFIL